MMVRSKRQFIGFGFDPGESVHHFAVTIPDDDAPVTIEERFAWNGEAKSLSDEERKPSIKACLDRYRWERIAEAVRGQFNRQIRAAGHRSVSWKTGMPNLLTSHFGKELTLLVWAVEDIDESLIPNVIANWIGLEPEERWWLYTTVNATFTTAETGKDRGWRKAIKIAFSENPVPEMPAERFVEEPEPIQLPQKEEVSAAISATPVSIRKRKRKIIRKPPQAPLFEES